ncbi:opacity family porin [Compostibacter hankyongensis]|uniref:Porin opacity type domain-containing protein n=1 Tax=Compostibacter hankyongensis TaxID=1007089 RepID=A0ABP8FG89_9BACT
MKKLLTVLICAGILGMAGVTHAQTQKGNLMIGSQLANIGGVFQNNSNEFDFSITPSIAYFIHDNLALGGMLNLGLEAPKGAPTTFTYGIGPWARYYFATPEELDFSKHAAFFLDGFVGFQGENHSKGGGSTNGLGIKVGPGVSYFITPNVALDAALDYNVVIGFGNATTVNRLAINLGFQIFLPTGKLKERYHEETNQ